uniref:Polynucleotide adenylyltransferase n=1 Tax=uncultured Helicobacter sp. TaxID=175537 RepID=A0A650ELK0_9HELI|nr:polynucleotide adenylyltransferase [uncultured Helicobacter sp.]
MNLTLSIPLEVQEILQTLESAGFKAYVVGGCVRDALLCQITRNLYMPKDWDITTSATPDEVMRVFADSKVLPTGLKHGTVSLIKKSVPYEITTFRIDGDYLNARSPESVHFSTSLEEDLKRRDFTINALVYHYHEGLVDRFCGLDDLQNGVIRCVGNANERLCEDALRILRALRFASLLGFTIEQSTKDAMFAHRQRLTKISQERIRVELTKLLCGKNVKSVLEEYAEIITVCIPEIFPMIGFRQHHPYHHLDVWGHTILAIDRACEDSIIRWTMLLHDIGKPHTFTQKEGVGHFYGHAQKSALIAEKILDRLRWDKKTKCVILKLITHHDIVLESSPKSVRRLLSKLDNELFELLLEVKKADILAQNPSLISERLKNLAEIREIKAQVLDSQMAFCLKDLAVNGRDLQHIGITEGKEIGKILSTLLTLVIEEKIENTQASLLREARTLYYSSHK